MKKIIFIVFTAIVLIVVALYFFTRNSDKANYYNNDQSKNMKITSKAFENNGSIPAKYTCDAGGEVVNPSLEISGVPERAKSLVLLMDDPDIPASVKRSMGIGKFDHWTLYDISPDAVEIGEGVSLGASGLNSAGKTGYTPPCPPDGEHRYFFKLYALDTNINFIKAPTQSDIEAAMQGHVLDSAELVGLYKRK